MRGWHGGIRPFAAIQAGCPKEDIEPPVRGWARQLANARIAAIAACQLRRPSFYSALRFTAHFKALAVGENPAVYGKFKDVEVLADRVLETEGAKI